MLCDCIDGVVKLPKGVVEEGWAMRFRGRVVLMTLQARQRPPFKRRKCASASSGWLHLPIKAISTPCYLKCCRCGGAVRIVEGVRWLVVLMPVSNRVAGDNVNSEMDFALNKLRK
jgi:hypothetical protein